MRRGNKGRNEGASIKLCEDYNRGQNKFAPLDWEMFEINMLEEKMDPTVKTKVEADPLQAVQGDPWKTTTVGHGNKQESISEQFRRKLEELNMPKKEEQKNELRRKLEELNMPKEEELKKEQALTKTTAGSIKDEFMRKLSMLEQESGPMTQGQATMDDDPKGLSESVEGSLPTLTR